MSSVQPMQDADPAQDTAPTDNAPQNASQSVSGAISAPLLESEATDAGVLLDLAVQLRHATGALTLSNNWRLARALSRLVRDNRALLQQNVELLGAELERLREVA